MTAPPPPATLLYLAGPPAAGKSTLMAALTAACTRTPYPQPLHHDTLHHPASPAPVAVEIGRRRDLFSGTDALALHIQPAAITWITTRPHPLVLGEGDRLATVGFLLAAHAAGYRVHLAVLDAPPAVLDARCAARGSTQNPAWRQGRATKTARLTAYAEAAGLHVATLDATRPTVELAAACHAAVPALAALHP